MSVSRRAQKRKDSHVIERKSGIPVVANGVPVGYVWGDEYWTTGRLPQHALGKVIISISVLRDAEKAGATSMAVVDPEKERPYHMSIASMWEKGTQIGDTLYVFIDRLINEPSPRKTRGGNR